MRKYIKERLGNMVMVVILLVFFAVFARPTPSAFVSRLSPIHHEQVIPAAVGQLELVQVAFRHGARTPLSEQYWPATQWVNCKDNYEGAQVLLRDENGEPDPPPLLDLNAPKLPGGCRQGQLTINGYRMAKNLGRWLRRRYVNQFDLLPAAYEPRTLAARTTCIDRTYKTLQGVITGLYPDMNLPIVANASREREEIMYGKNTTCARLGPMFETLSSKLAEKEARSKSLAKLAERVAAALHLQDEAAGTHNVSWIRLRDTLAAMEADNITLPKGATDFILDLVSVEAIREEAAIIGPSPSDGLVDEVMCQEVIRLSIGPLIHRLLTNMKAAAAAPNECRLGVVPDNTDCPPKMILFAGHDSTVTPLIIALGVNLDDWPPFASNVVFELWHNKEEGQQFVRILYDGEVVQLQHAITGGFVALDELEYELTPYTIGNVAKQTACELSDDANSLQQQDSSKQQRVLHTLTPRNLRYRRMEPSL